MSGPALWLMLAACTDTSGDYAIARDRCGLSEEDYSYAGESGSGALQFVVSRDCARHIGGDFGLDWESFGARPGRVDEIRDPLDGTLAALYQLLASNYGTVSALSDSGGGAPLWFQAHAPELAEAAGLSSDSPAGALLYRFLYEHIRRVQADDGVHDARYEKGSQTLLLNPEHDVGRLTFGWLAVLVHEAAHVSGEPHVTCPDGPEVGASSCDESAEGATGMEIYVPYLWQRKLDRSDPDQRVACLEVAQHIDEHCALLIDPAGFAPCEVPLSCDPDAR